MAFWPTDLSSFSWGIAAGAVAAFGTGFLQKLGEEAYRWVAGKVNPPPIEPMQVDGRFEPTAYAPGTCAWVSEARLYEFEAKGYEYYPHPKSKGKCFRITSDGRNPFTEFLMVQPGAEKVTDA